MSNQRPASAVEFRHTIDSRKKTLAIDSDGICDACRVAEQKQTIDWNSREEQLLQLLDRYRSKDGSYDCLVPGSGGKDSAYQAHVLKYKYGMHPLTVTWPPILYTEYGYQNWKNWIDVGGFDNLSFTRNGRVMKLLTRLSIENLFHPFQTFILGQKNPRTAPRCQNGHRHSCSTAKMKRNTETPSPIPPPASATNPTTPMTTLRTCISPESPFAS
jgi:hypothetical protein